MFTGLVKDIGCLVSQIPNSEGKTLEVRSEKLAPLVEIDDSVSINGACQTVIAKTKNTFKVQAVHTTLEKTTLGKLKVGQEMNLELALQLSDRLGGHIVQGHVNGMGKIKGWQQKGKNYLLSFSLPEDLRAYVVLEGSITLNGVSLTVSHLDSQKEWASVSIIPHTWDNTVFKNSQIGENLNIEVDILAKYVESLLFSKNNSDKNVNNSQNTRLTEAWLRENGF